MLSYIDLDLQFDVDELKESLNDIAELFSHQEQIALQYRQDTDVMRASTDGIGSLSYGSDITTDAVFNIWNPLIEDTYIVECLKSLSFPVVRTRIMPMNPKTCYSMHKDKSIRLHLPIECAYDTYGGGGRFVFDHGEVLKFEEGRVVIVNTKLTHSAMNCSLDKIRYHIVTCLPEKHETDNKRLLEIYDRFKI